MVTKQKQIEEEVFRLLDPTLRLLIACNEQLTSVVPFSSHHDHGEEDEDGSSVAAAPLLGSGTSTCTTNTDTTNNSPYQRNSIEVVLTLYKTQSSLFQRLQNDIASFFVDAETDSDEVELCYRQKALHDMEEYITLPILLSLQQQQQQQQKQQQNLNQDNPDTNSMNNSESNSAMILNSAHRKSIETASSCLTTYIHSLQQQQTHDDSKKRNSRDHQNTCVPTVTTRQHLSVKLRMKCVVALTMSLTSIIESKEQTQAQTKMISMSASNLDKGDECIQELLICLRLLILPLSPTTVATIDGERQFVLELVNFIPNSGLIVGIVQNCIKCFNNDDRTGSMGVNRSNEDRQRNNNDVGDIRGNVELKLHALKLLEALLGLSCDRNKQFHSSKSSGEKVSSDDNLKRSKEEDSIILCFRLIFPTCFSVLYRQLHLHLQFTTSFSSSKLAVQYMIVLSLLMKKTLQQYDNDQAEESHTKTINDYTKKNHVVEESKKSFMAAVSNHQANVKASATSRTDAKNKVNNVSDANTKEYEEFVNNVKQRIPFPLTILCHLIPTHTSIKVRKAGVQFLCKCILVDTYMIWEGGEDYGGLDSLRQSAFECLIIMLNDKNNQVSEMCMEVFDLHQMRVSEYFQNDKTNRHYMMSCVLEIIQGLPSIARSRRESDLKVKMRLISGYVSVICRMISSKKDKGTISRDFFLRKIMNNPYKRCLADVFCLEDINDNNYVVPVESSSNQQFKYMQEDAAIVARSMINTISQLLGPKNCAIFADGCIADIFDSLLDRTQNRNLSVCDKTHFIWTQHNYGIAVIALELIKGQEEIGLKKRHLKIFKSFGKSILPILFSNPLWQLPSSFQWAQPMEKNSTKIIQGSVFQYSQHNLLPTSTMKGIIRDIKQNVFVPGISAMALHGNGLLQISLMQIIETLSTILGTNFAEYIPTIIYPLLQKTSDISSAMVQKAALDTLVSVSLSSGYKSFDQMLSAHFRYIIEVFSLELQGPFFTQSEEQLREQAVCFYSLHTIVRFILKDRVEESGQARGVDRSNDLDDETEFMVLIDMMQTINDWFNKNFKKSVIDLVKLMVVPLGMLQVFKGCTEYIDSLLQLHMKAHQNTDIDKKLVLSSDTLSRLINTMKRTMLTNSIFLSTPDLKLQREACDLFVTCFHLLSTVQRYTKDSKNDTTIDLGNPLFETLSKYWFPLQSRFQAIAQSFIDMDKNSDIARIHLGLLLSSLLNMISTLSELCDGFITDRFQNTIFPHMSKLLNLMLHNVEEMNRGSTASGDRLLRKEDVIVLNALLDCIRRVFSADGSHLSAMVPVVGSIILPFIGLDGDSGLSAMEATKALVRVDSDCLWRALLEGSGTGIPARRLLPLPVQNSPKQTNSKSCFSRRCLEIIQFVNELPEQEIFY